MATVPPQNPPSDEFTKVIRDFIKDIRITFPEYCPLINKWWKTEEDFSYIQEPEKKAIALEKAEKMSIQVLFTFCRKKYPPRFFEILYKNEEIFSEESDIDTEFLPHIHFKSLWAFKDITEKTKEILWKYLQLILFSIINTVQDQSMFGDTAKLFEAINEDEFKAKLEETIGSIEEMFASSPSPSSASDATPNPDEIHQHISGILDGKLGKLAKEIAEETAQDLNMDMDNTGNIKEIFQKLIKNPTKLMGLVKNVGDKLQTKIQTGEIKESEMLEEAMDMMNKMKNLPGMDGMQSMLGKMGLGKKGAKINYSAMEANLQRKMKTAQMKERMRAKMEAKKEEAKKEEEKKESPSIPKEASAPPVKKDKKKKHKK